MTVLVREDLNDADLAWAAADAVAANVVAGVLRVQASQAAPPVAPEDAPRLDSVLARVAAAGFQ